MASYDAGEISTKRDREYYFSDGSCLFLVEDRVLFKIHRSRLEADSVVFHDMFSLPQPHVGSPAESPEEPIILHDTVRDFRALCWALYAKPSEIAAQMIPEKINVGRLVNVISMAQKYDFADLRDWAFSTLDFHLRSSRVLCSDWTVIEKLLKFAYGNGKDDLAIRIEQKWLHSIMSSPHQGNYFVKALDIAERLNLRQFHGKIYHCYLKAIGKFDPSSPSDDAPAMHIGNAASLIEKELICDDLDDTRRLRLYHGFLSLTQLRNSLNKALPLSDNPQCSKHANCQRGWDNWWSSFLTEVQRTRGHLYDPDDFFQELEKRILTYPIRLPTGTREVFCQALIKTQVCATKKHFEDTLADHFMIPASRQE